MERPFEKQTVPCLKRALWQVQDREQTQEVRLGDEMPDIGSILSVRGQCVLRGKEWMGDSVTISGGVMVWAIYVPADGTGQQMIESWIPVQFKGSLSGSQREGSIRCALELRSLDGRTISPRKMMIRGVVSALIEAMEPSDAAVAIPGQLPEDVQLLRRRYPMVLPAEAGEKSFLVDEELTLPAGGEAPEKIWGLQVVPRMDHPSVVGNKTVTRGVLQIHLCYQGVDGQLHSADLEAPFSQFSDLDRDYEKEATVSVTPALTNLEHELQEGKLQIRCGVTAQYVIWDCVMVELIEDAYSVCRTVQPRQEPMELPAILDQCTETIRCEGTVSGSASQVVDAWICHPQPRIRRAGDLYELEVSGTVGVAYLDQSGKLQSGTGSFSQVVEHTASEGSLVIAELAGAATPVVTVGPEQMDLRLELTVQTRICARDGMTMVTALDLGDQTQPDPGRPSVIMRRSGGRSLWALAKVCGSTVEAISKANGLTEEPTDDAMLLIPVV